ncbi:NACHT domain-containing protein [Geomonas limicola]|nr:hypothetical protein [Geomonas limicola]
MGKTTFFKEAAVGGFTTVRKFLVDPQCAEGEPLFLDALDEFRAVASGSDIASEIAKALCALKKPKFRLSCRSADWFGSTDQEVIRAASASGRIVVLELCPLCRDEVLSAVQGVVADPAKFVEEAEAAGLAGLLGNPQTLELLARAWATTRKPRNKFEAYQTGVSELLKEANPLHQARGATSVALDDLRKAAGAACSILLLSNTVGVSRLEMADDDFFALHIVPDGSRRFLDLALKRRLFTSPGVDRFEPLHRTIAEFLAAEDLATRIDDGLPIDRVLALICGTDGNPISSLRGLFAWLMCWLGPLAEGYVERDPYGVATYGDASALSPGVQCAIWRGLRGLRDPWFLSHRDERASFRELANLNTSKLVRGILEDPAAGAHLKTAALEAISNSTAGGGYGEILRDMVLSTENYVSLRSTALTAFAKTIDNDVAQLAALDCDLAQASYDQFAPDVRAGILSFTRSAGCFAQQMLAVLKQAASVKRARHTFGRFYNLVYLPADSDLEELLDGGSLVLTAGTGVYYELRSMFDAWLERRLRHPAPVSIERLSGWLSNRRPGNDRYSAGVLASLNERFQKEPSLFGELFQRLLSTVPHKERSLESFLCFGLFKLLPAEVWPVSPCAFFLDCAAKEDDPFRAGVLFERYLWHIPEEGASVIFVEAGFEFMSRRPDVGKTLGNWRSCKIDGSRKKQQKRALKAGRKEKAVRAYNVAAFHPHLASIRTGTAEEFLVEALEVYLGYSNDEGIPDLRERLVSFANPEIADACIEGFLSYAENPSIPTKQEIIESWQTGSIPNAHILLALSVFMRLDAGITVPVESLPHCLAAVITEYNAYSEIHGFSETLCSWVLETVAQHPSEVSSVLKELWLRCSAAKKGELPIFYELSKDPGSLPFLVKLSTEVLESGIVEDNDTVRSLALVLLHNDRQAARAVAESELSRKELSIEVRATWCTVLFVIDPTSCSDTWRAIMLQSSTARWSGIEIIQEGGRLAPMQLAEAIATFGGQFPPAELPTGTFVGRQNAWDASRFVSHLIEVLASDSSPESGVILESLETHTDLERYRDSIRHHRAQQAKKLREAGFSFASPEQVVEALSNGAPATSRDLAALVVDHLRVLTRELRLTQRERFRAYWNEEGKTLLKPKCEENCSGLLAEDLQNRVKPQKLIVTVEHHMVADKECDLVVLQGPERLLPIEVKHHYHSELWTAWRSQLDHLYARDAKAEGLGVYLVLWSGEAKGRKMPKLPVGISRPTTAAELESSLVSLVPDADRCRLLVVVVDISEP